VPPRLTAVPDDEPSAVPDGDTPLLTSDVGGTSPPERPTDDDARLDDALSDDDANARPAAGGDTRPTDAGARPEHGADWFDALVRAHTPAVHRYLVRRVGAGDADDLTADVLVVAWRRRDDVPDDAALPWLYRTAGFVVANHRRKGRPIPVGDVPDEPTDDDPAVAAVRDEQVRAVLRALSPRDRQIVLLNAWEGLAGDELARVLGIGRGGADAALSRARARLTEAWRELVVGA
jgi:RNA polymerase sigma-70 factor (ECF subfamily)